MDTKMQLFTYQWNQANAVEAKSAVLLTVVNKTRSIPAIGLDHV